VADGGLAAQDLANWITVSCRLLRDNDVEIDATRVSARNLAALWP
jgi:hypothetical protein